jgi:hypothetical protein
MLTVSPAVRVGKDRKAAHLAAARAKTGGAAASAAPEPNTYDGELALMDLRRRSSFQFRGWAFDRLAALVHESSGGKPLFFSARGRPQDGPPRVSTNAMPADALFGVSARNGSPKARTRDRPFKKRDILHLI